MVAQYFRGQAEELFAGRVGSPFVHAGPREYVRRFRVMTLDKRIGSLGVGYAPGLPAPYSPYLSGNGMEFDLRAFLVRYDTRQELEDDWQAWIVEAHYSTDLGAVGFPTEIGNPFGSQGQGRRPKSGSQSDPTLQPPEIYWVKEVVNRALQHDRNGKPFLNSCGQPLTPAPTFPFPVLVLNVIRNETAYNPQVAAHWSFCINSEEFLGMRPGQWFSDIPTAKLEHFGDYPYHRVHYVFKLSPMTLELDPVFGLPEGEFYPWQPRFLDQGLCELKRVPVEGPPPEEGWPIRPVPIERWGHPITQPVLLDGNGQEALKDEEGNITAHWLDFNVHKEVDFNELFENGLQTPLQGPGVLYWKLPHL